jgi:hypothetical protein
MKGHLLQVGGRILFDGRRITSSLNTDSCLQQVQHCHWVATQHMAAAQQATKLGELARAAQIAADRIDEEFLKGGGTEDVRGAVLDEIRLVVENFPTGGYGSDPVPFPNED